MYLMAYLLDPNRPSEPANPEQGGTHHGGRGMGCPLNPIPTPHTLHPTPYTLHPTPYTLHPTPYALHPTPYTLHPTPYTLGG